MANVTSLASLTAKEKETLLEKLSYMCYIIDKSQEKTVMADRMIEAVCGVLDIVEKCDNEICSGEIAVLHNVLSTLWNRKVEEGRCDFENSFPVPLKGWVLRDLKKVTSVLAFCMGFGTLEQLDCNPIRIMFYREKDWTSPVTVFYPTMYAVAK